MGITRYSIRNVYGLGHGEACKTAADKDDDDPEALLEAVAMSGLVGLLRQLGDLAQFAAEIFQDLHEEVMSTAARGQGLLVRVQKLESEIPLIEREFLSQTSNSAFCPNSGIEWHPNRKLAQNLVTAGDLPRFVMDSYEQCRGPPRLFLLDKFDVGGAGACLKRYTDPAVYKVEASTYEIERASKQRDKKIRQTKNKGIGWNGGETPYVTQSSHVNRLHQLFLEERVQNGVTEPVHCVKLKQRSKRSPFDSESGESYMKKILNSPFEDRSVHEALVCSSPLTLPSDTSSKSRIETPENNIMGSFLGSAMQSISPYVSSSLETTICEGSTYKLQKSEIQEVDEEQIGAVDEEVKMDGFQNGYPSDEVVSDTDNYMDALATMESEIETSSNQGTYSDANKDQLQSQSSGSRSMENTIVSDYENKPIRKRITLSVDFDTTSMSTDNASPVAIDSPLRPFASFEIPFRPRDPPVAEKQLVTRHPDNDVTTDTCIDARKESMFSSGFDTDLHVDQVEEGQSTETNSDKGSSNHAERFDSPRKVKDRQVNLEVTVECISEHPDFIPTVVKGDIENKYPIDTSIPKTPIPNILDTKKVEYPDEKLSTGSVDSQWNSSHSVISRTDEQRSDIDGVEVEPSVTTFSDDDVPVVDETADNLDIYTLPEQESEDMVDGVSHKSGPEEAKVSYPIEDNIEGAKVSEIEMVTGAVSDLLDVKEETELEVRETEVNPVPSHGNVDRDVGKDLGDDTELKGIDADSVNTEMEMSAVVSLPVDVHKKDDNVPSTFGNHSVIDHSKEPGEAVEVDQLLIKYTDFDYVPSDTCDEPNNDIDSSSLDSEILHDHSQHVFSQMDEKKVVLHDLGSPSVYSAPCDHSDVQFLDNTSEITVFPEANHHTEFASLDDKIYHPNDKIDIFTAVQSSPLEDNVDHPNGQVCAGTSLLLSQLDSRTHLDHKTLFNTHTGPYGVKHTSQPAVEENDQVESIHLPDLQSSPKTCSVPAFERAPTVESLQASSHDSSLFHHVKHQPAPVKLKSMPPLPPPPPNKWWMRKPPTDGGKHRDNYIPPVSPSKPNVGLKVGGDSILDEIRSLFTKTKNSQNGAGSFSMLSRESKLHTKDHDSLSVSSEGTITQAAVEIEYSCSLHTEGHDTQSVSPEAMVLQTEVEKEQSSLPPIVEKLSNNILPMLPSTPIKDPQVVGHSTLDDITGLNAENQTSQHSSGGFSQMSSPVSNLNTDDPNDSYVSPEATVPQAAVETGNFCIITAASDQEAFQPNPSPVDTIISNFPPVFPSTPTDDSQAVGQSKLDEKPQHGVGSSPGSNIHTNNHENSPVSPEETVPQAAVETEQSYSLSAIVDEKPTKSTPVFPSTPKEDLHVVAQSTVDVIRYLDTENKKSFSHKSSPKSSVHTEKHGKTSVSAKVSLAENSMPQTSVPITYGQENLSPSSNRYALQRPRTPLADAVSPNDKYKLKVSDQATNQIPKGEAHDNILDQIRAKSFKLKPAAETRPTSIRGPLTNLRVAAMIEKANAIRQAFAGSDDDSDGWSD